MQKTNYSNKKMVEKFFGKERKTEVSKKMPNQEDVARAIFSPLMIDEAGNLSRAAFFYNALSKEIGRSCAGQHCTSLKWERNNYFARSITYKNSSQIP